MSVLADSTSIVEPSRRWALLRLGAQQGQGRAGLLYQGPSRVARYSPVGERPPRRWICRGETQGQNFRDTCQWLSPDSPDPRRDLGGQLGSAHHHF